VSTAVTPTAAGLGPALRRLYVVRSGFALVWAVLLVAVGRQFEAVAAVLVVLYPLFDAAAAVVDTRASRSTSPHWGTRLTIVVRLVAALGLGVAAALGVPEVLRVWGGWAIIAGLVQLVVGISRRRLGGQWPMMLSGGISVLAGTGFVLMSGTAGASLVGVAGYAVLGGVFFLVSALRLGRAARER
jgi:uncharacterized membrane protein HdeD (DUF308 family)